LTGPFDLYIDQTPDVCKPTTNGIQLKVTTDLLIITIKSIMYFTAVEQSQNVLYQMLIVLQITLMDAVPKACLY